jgi:hypothetical protein
MGEGQEAGGGGEMVGNRLGKARDWGGGRWQEAFRTKKGGKGRGTRVLKLCGKAHGWGLLYAPVAGYCRV